jgi:hypothetical protein
MGFHRIADRGHHASVDGARTMLVGLPRAEVHQSRKRLKLHSRGVRQRHHRLNNSSGCTRLVTNLAGPGLAAEHAQPLAAGFDQSGIVALAHQRPNRVDRFLWVCCLDLRLGD